MSYFNANASLAGCLLAGVAILAGSCTTHSGGDVPLVDSYEQFMQERYHESVLRRDMQLMADSLRSILIVASDSTLVDQDKQAAIVGELKSLKNLADIVDADAEIYSYTTRNPYMGSFLHDITAATEFARNDPPDFRPATGLIKSCLFCHKDL